MIKIFYILIHVHPYPAVQACILLYCYIVEDGTLAFKEIKVQDTFLDSSSDFWRYSLLMYPCPVVQACPLLKGHWFEGDGTLELALYWTILVISGYMLC